MSTAIQNGGPVKTTSETLAHPWILRPLAGPQPLLRRPPARPPPAPALRLCPSKCHPRLQRGQGMPVSEAHTEQPAGEQRPGGPGGQSLTGSNLAADRIFRPLCACRWAGSRLEKHRNGMTSAWPSQCHQREGKALRES